MADQRGELGLGLAWTVVPLAVGAGLLVGVAAAALALASVGCNRQAARVPAPPAEASSPPADAERELQRLLAVEVEVPLPPCWRRTTVRRNLVAAGGLLWIDAWSDRRILVEAPEERAPKRIGYDSVGLGKRSPDFLYVIAGMSPGPGSTMVLLALSEANQGQLLRLDATGHLLRRTHIDALAPVSGFIRCESDSNGKVYIVERAPDGKGGAEATQWMDGITVLEPVPFAVSLVRRDLDEGLEQRYPFDWVSTYGVSPEGDVYVANRKTSRTAVYGRDGRMLQRFTLEAPLAAESDRGRSTLCSIVGIDRRQNVVSVYYGPEHTTWEVCVHDAEGRLAVAPITLPRSGYDDEPPVWLSWDGDLYYVEGQVEAPRLVRCRLPVGDPLSQTRTPDEATQAGQGRAPDG